MAFAPKIRSILGSILTVFWDPPGDLKRGSKMTPKWSPKSVANSSHQKLCEQRGGGNAAGVGKEGGERALRGPGGDRRCLCVASSSLKCEACASSLTH